MNRHHTKCSNVSHPLDWLEAHDVKRLFQHPARGFTEEDPAHIHLNDLPRDPVLLDAVAHVVELGKRGAQFVQVVAESVGK